jgi:hypothetical protein
MDPADPIASEHAMMNRLGQIGIGSQPNAAKALIALGILALGLVLLANATKDA